ncbi:MAG: PilZ domain-containing protein [Desulfovibrionaceae bacterium]
MPETIQLNIMVGTRCVVEPGAVGVRFASQFVGWVPGRFCILLPPRRAELADPLTPDHEITVRYLDCRGVLCGFRVYVQSLVYAPQRLIFIDYPTAQETLRVRKQDRVECFLPATLDISGKQYVGHLVDISAGGFRFSKDREDGDGRHALPRGADLACRFSLLGDAVHEIEVAGRIKEVTLGATRVVVRGVFRSQPDEAARAIADYVAAATRHIEGACIMTEA